jgi:hypothetical protein
VRSPYAERRFERSNRSMYAWIPMPRRLSNSNATSS